MLIGAAAVAVVVASIETEENLRSYYVAVAVVDGFVHSAVVGPVVLTSLSSSQKIIFSLLTIANFYCRWS